MGISSALYSGVSGLNTNSQAMSVIGNNLANTNTLGFKGSRTVFSDLLSASINGSGGTSQVGRGVGMSRVDGIFSQGTFESTESPLDVAIEGDGFFILSQPDSDTQYFSRAGAFRFNKEGYLVNPEGYQVLGQPYDVLGNLVPGVPTEIQINNLGLAAGEATSEIAFTTNLDASTQVPATLPAFDYADPSTYDYSTSTQVFDTLGTPQLITTYYKKTDGPELGAAAPNTWSVYWTAQDTSGTPLGSIGTTAAGPPPVYTPPAAAATLIFDADGDLTTIPTTLTISAADLDWGNGSDPQDITVTFNTTQFNSASSVISQEQNGYGAGELTGVNIDENGAVIASYANGKKSFVANLSLATFRNPNGLEAVGSNVFQATTSSGVPRTGLPGPELGKIFTNSLEQSNVDMGTEFVRMITVQRGFQANSKIITTVDELLGELINLKR